jgi:ankyrin repeat protein
MQPRQHIIRTSTAALVWLVGTVLSAAEPALLADAVEQRNHAAVARLLAANADPNAPQPDGATPLHWAVHHDKAELVAQLVAAGAKVDAVNDYGVTPLALACQNGSEAIVRRLLDAGADPNRGLPGGETPLLTAARTGRLGPVQALLARQADVNAQERKGQTALMWAAAEGHVDVVDALLAAGADRDTRVRSGFNAFFFAAREGKSAVVERLLRAGCEVNSVLKPTGGDSDDKETTTALLLATENGHFDLASDLLAAGADPNLHPAGYTALHAISWVRKPIRGDGDPPPIGSGRTTSLEFVRCLVNAGADVNARLEHGAGGRGRFNTNGSTPFLLAARTSDLPLMKLLLELGADPQIPNHHHSPPLLAAAGVGALSDGDEAAATEPETVAAVRFLLDLGAEVNAVDDNGETAMHGAAYQSWPAVVRLLVERGADVKVWHRKNTWGWTPLLIAEGHRPGNFRPAPDTIAAIHEMLRASGIEPPPPTPASGSGNEYPPKKPTKNGDDRR